MLISFFIGIIVGMLLHTFLTNHFSKKSEPLTIQGDPEKMVVEIGEIKRICQANDLSQAEKEFYVENKVD